MKIQNNNSLASHREDYTLTRRVWDRMLKLHQLLAKRKYPNCSTIARDFEISLATAARDIDFMRYQWQFPIEYDKQRHGFYYSEPIVRLPWVPITEAELFAVCISTKVLGLFRGMSLQQPLEQAFAKITQNLDKREMLLLDKLHQSFSIWVFPSEMPDLQLMELATRAAANHQGMRFTYRKPGARTPEVRTVHPYHVDAFDGRVYLQAFDPSRGAERKFVIHRMSNVALTGHAFERPKDFDPQKAFDSALALMSGQGDYHVVVELDPWLTDILRGRRLHASQQVTELPSGGAHLSLRLSTLDLIEQSVLSWGTHATVLEPQELRDRLFRTTGELNQRYAPAAPPDNSPPPSVQLPQPSSLLPHYAN